MADSIIRHTKTQGYRERGSSIFHPAVMVNIPNVKIRIKMINTDMSDQTNVNVSRVELVNDAMLVPDDPACFQSVL